MTAQVLPGGLRADGLPAALPDPRRAAAVNATGLPGTGTPQPFADLVALAVTITGCGPSSTPVDQDRSFWKSCAGVDLDQVPGRQGAVRDSFCCFLAGLEGAPFVAGDAAWEMVPG